jgi:hypothetical protein
MLAKTVDEWDAKFGDAPTPPNLNSTTPDVA